MANTIKIKRSTGSSAPTTLAFGELAYSSGSGKLYFGSSTDGTAVTVREIGGAAFTDLLSATAGTASASKALIVDANRSIANLGTVTATSFVGDVTGTVSSIANHTTDALTEGTTNKYFTQARARQSISVTDSGGDGSMSYDSSTGVITYTGPSATEARAHFSATTTGTGHGDLAYDSATGVFTLTKVSSANIRGELSATTSGTGYGSLSYDSTTGAFTYAKVTTADIRGQFSGGTGVTITDGSIAIGQAVGTTSNVTFNDVTVSGNLTVNGTTTTVNSTTLEVADKNITVAKGAVDAAAANGAGLTVEGPATPATLTYASADDSWNFNKQVKANVTGALTGNADTATTLKDARNFSASGDASASAVSFNGSANVDLSLTLATVNSNVGQFGSASEVPVVTVNAKGLVTAVSTASISTSFTVAAETGSNQTFNNGKTLTVAAGEGIDTSVAVDGSGNVTVTVAGELATDTNKGVASFDSGNFAVTSGAVTIKAGGVTATELATDAVETAKIKNDAVTTAKILDGNVTNAKLANSSITLTGGTGSDAVALGESLAISGAGSISTAVTANTVTVSVATADTSGTKGVASFNGDHFSVTDGVVSAILDGGTY